MADLRTLKQYFRHLEAERSYWDEGDWKDISENLLPEWEDIRRQKAKGARKARKIFDSSPRDYLNIFADGMHGNLIPPGLVWFEQTLPARFKFLADDPAVAQFLRDVTDQLFFAYSNSNFYSQMRRYFRAGGGLGTSNLHLEPDMAEGRLVFRNLHPRESYFAENKHGFVDVCFRLFRPSARIMKQEFGEQNLSGKVKRALSSNGNPFTEFDVIHATYPNEEFNDKLLGNRFKRFRSTWFELSGDDQPGAQKFLRESGHRVFPFHPWRYIRGENGPYGDSPATLALPEIMGLQQMRKTLLRAGHLAVDPPLNVPSEMKNKVRMGNHGMNYVGPDMNRVIKPVNTGIQYPIGQDNVNDAREILKRHYHVDFFTLLQSRENSRMTLREVQELVGEKASILSAGVGDLTNVLDGIHDHTYDIEQQAGRMPTPPDILLEHMGGMRIPIEYLGPLAIAQKRSFESKGITDALAIAEPFIKNFPETADIIAKDETLAELLKAHGFQQTLIVPTNVVADIRQSRAEQQQQENQKIDMERLADVLKSLAMADKQSQGKFNQQIQEILGNSQPGGLPQVA